MVRFDVWYEGLLSILIVVGTWGQYSRLCFDNVDLSIWLGPLGSPEKQFFPERPRNSGPSEYDGSN